MGRGFTAAPLAAAAKTEVLRLASHSPGSGQPRGLAEPQLGIVGRHANALQLMIEVSQLTKTYGSRTAVQGLDFRVGKGEVVGFLGPNGAGKTTTLRIIAGFLGPTSGRVRVAGFDVVDEPLRARAQLGYMPETSPSYPELRVIEYLRFRAELKGVQRAKRQAAVERALSLASLGDRAGSVIGHLSKGYRQRLGLADALVADPPLLILDEPTSGLDPNQIREVRRVIRDLAEQHTVLLSTHILAEVEASCDRAIVIHRGRRVAEGTLDELRSRGTAKEGTLLVRRTRDATTDDAPDGPQKPKRKKRTSPAAAKPEDSSAHAAPSTVLVPEALRSDVLEEMPVDADYVRLRVNLPEGRASMERWVAEFSRQGTAVAEARLGSASLEQVFAELTNSEESVI